MIGLDTLSYCSIYSVHFFKSLHNHSNDLSRELDWGPAVLEGLKPQMNWDLGKQYSILVYFLHTDSLSDICKSTVGHPIRKKIRYDE